MGSSFGSYETNVGSNNAPVTPAPRHGFPHSSGCLGTHSVERAGLELKRFTCLYFLNAGIKGIGSTAWHQLASYVPSPSIGKGGLIWPSDRNGDCPAVS